MQESGLTTIEGGEWIHWSRLKPVLGIPFTGTLVVQMECIDRSTLIGLVLCAAVNDQTVDQNSRTFLSDDRNKVFVIILRHTISEYIIISIALTDKLSMKSCFV